MADQEEDELQMALRMSLQSVGASPPEAKRSKAGEVPLEETPEARSRRIQRELMAAAAEKRMKAAAEASTAATPAEKIVSSVVKAAERADSSAAVAEKAVTAAPGEQLSLEVANQLFAMVFGSEVSKGILSHWSNQGIRFSSDPETSLGLVQHEGGPCGVLATLQAFVLKYLLFFPDGLGITPQSLARSGTFQSSFAAKDNFAAISEDRKLRALVLSMVEILFSCGSNRKAIVATIDLHDHCPEEESDDPRRHEMIAKALESVHIDSASDLQEVLRIRTYTSQSTAFDGLMAELPVLQSRMGALLFLISALMTRSLDAIQEDRDDPSLPLVTAPFGHASQEIVNLLLCGEAVPNVFDGRMDLGGGMFLKGIPRSVEVGFLTLLESLNFCKVGQHLKRPKWPIWVVGSESHYTVLFALETSVQDENELEERESKIRKVFDAHDQSGGGGFINVEGFHQVLKECNVNFPPEKIENLTFSGIVVWSEFWQALLELDKNSGGLKDSSGSMGKRVFDLYHFNGIAKSVLNGNASSGGESPAQRPRLCKLNVCVPPKWTQDEFLANVGGKESSSGTSQPSEPSQHAPLVDCIRTRWPRAVCSWDGDAPSIV